MSFTSDYQNIEQYKNALKNDIAIGTRLRNI